MAKVVVGLYDHIEDARQVVEGLVNSGFSSEAISLVAADTLGEFSRYASAAGSRSEADGAISGVGAVIGRLGRLLTGLGVLGIADEGQVLAAGPLVAILTEEGSLSAALAEMGIPKDQAGRFVEGVRHGGVLVTMAAVDEQVNRAVDLMDRFNPVDIDERYEAWQQTGEDVKGGEEDPEPAGIEAWETTFRSHYQDSLELHNFSYDELHPAYAYGYALAKDPRFQDVGWSEIEPEARLEWERTYTDSRWEDFKHAVLDAWRTVSSQETPASSAPGNTALPPDEHDLQITMRDADEESQRAVDSPAPGSGLSAGYSGPGLESFEPIFHKHFEATYSSHGRGYGDLRPAYVYGATLARNPQYTGRSWEEIEPSASRAWDQEHAAGAWEDFKEAVRTGWEAASFS